MPNLPEEIYANGLDYFKCDTNETDWATNALVALTANGTQSPPPEQHVLTDLDAPPAVTQPTATDATSPDPNGQPTAPNGEQDILRLLPPVVANNAAMVYEIESSQPSSSLPPSPKAGSSCSSTLAGQYDAANITAGSLSKIQKRAMKAEKREAEAKKQEAKVKKQKAKRAHADSKKQKQKKATKAETKKSLDEARQELADQLRTRAQQNHNRRYQRGIELVASRRFDTFSERRQMHLVGQLQEMSVIQCSHPRDAILVDMAEQLVPRPATVESAAMGPATQEVPEVGQSVTLPATPAMTNELSERPAARPDHVYILPAVMGPPEPPVAQEAPPPTPQQQQAAPPREYKRSEGECFCHGEYYTSKYLNSHAKEFLVDRELMESQKMPRYRSNTPRNPKTDRDPDVDCLSFNQFMKLLSDTHILTPENYPRLREAVTIDILRKRRQKPATQTVPFTDLMVLYEQFKNIQFRLEDEQIPTDQTAQTTTQPEHVSAGTQTVSSDSDISNMATEAAPESTSVGVQTETEATSDQAIVDELKRFWAQAEEQPNENDDLWDFEGEGVDQMVQELLLKELPEGDQEVAVLEDVGPLSPSIFNEISNLELRQQEEDTDQRPDEHPPQSPPLIDLLSPSHSPASQHVQLDGVEIVTIGIDVTQNEVDDAARSWTENCANSNLVATNTDAFTMEISATDAQTAAAAQVPIGECKLAESLHRSQNNRELALELTEELFNASIWNPRKRKNSSESDGQKKRKLG